MSDEPRSTAEWQRIPPTRVPLADLHPQHPVRPEWVADKLRYWWRSHSHDVYPHVARQADVLLIRDGHHRIARERELGRVWTWARIYEGGERP